MAPIGFHVQAVQMCDGIFQRTPILDRPPAELFDGLQIKIESLGTDAAFVCSVGTACVQVLDQLACTDIS
jgi:hypothetical protein